MTAIFISLLAMLFCFGFSLLHIIYYKQPLLGLLCVCVGLLNLIPIIQILQKMQ